MFRYAVSSALVLTLVSTLSATPPDQIPVNAGGGPGGPNVPQAGYRRTVELLRLTRQANIPGIALAPGVNLNLNGVRSVPVVCVSSRIGRTISGLLLISRFCSMTLQQSLPHPILPSLSIIEISRMASSYRLGRC